MGMFSFLSPKPATKIATNLYLGDKNHVPSDADFVVVCSIELMKGFVKLNKKHKIDIDEIIADPKKPRIFLRLVDWARISDVNIETTIKALNIIDEKIKEGKKVYVHCMYGVNRSASHCFMYVVGKKIINEPTFAKAFSKFKQIYPGINPIFGWKKLLKYYYPYYDFFDKDATVLSKKTAYAKYRKDKWLAKVKKKAKRKEEKAHAKNFYK
jgi:hypothetical protein